ncbi:MAG: penicillin-insensitive murein endopeptidase, partial [Elusimicrobia bacterium]|nr:penicillin-insensitive murein endopeptidase [Elusimicrobiota bacterium]
SAAARDVIAGKPITTEMGWAPGVVNPWLHNTTPARLDGAAGVDRMLPVGLPGMNRECQRGSDPNYACWGTKDMVTILAAMGQKYDSYFKNLGGGKFRIGDISKRGGGYLSGHVSHQRGVDVDLRFVGGRGGFNVQANVMTLAALALSVPNFHHIPGQQMVLVDQSLHPAIGAGLDRLVKEGVITGDEASRMKGSLRHWPNHRDHFHLRIVLGDMIRAPQAPGGTPAADNDGD